MQANYPSRCEQHAIPSAEYTNIIEKPCNICKLTYFLGSKNICDYCQGVQDKIHHKKEDKIKKLFDANNITYSHDLIIDRSCSCKRPDFVIEYPHFYLIVEVDENQHSSYPCECEQSRMIQIHNDCKGTPVIFIRYNPDDYTTNGIKYPWNKSRETTLLKVIKSFDNIDDWFRPLSVMYLFYDGYDGKHAIEDINYLNIFSLQIENN